MSASGASFTDRLRQALPTIATVLIAIGFVNFFWFIFEAMALGTASSGQIIDGRYFLNNKGIYTEVGQAMWVWSQIHEASLLVTHPLTLASIAYLSVRRSSASRRLPRHEPAIQGIDPRLSTALEVLGLCVGVALVTSGVLWAIPRLGGFGLLWTIGAAGILAWNAWSFLRRKRSRSVSDGTAGATMSSATTFGLLATGVFVVIGMAGFTATLAAPIPQPAGRAAFVPSHPAGPHVYLAPIGTFPTADLDELVGFYAVRYDLDVKVLAPAPTIPPTPARNQIDARALGALLRSVYPEAADPKDVIIGVLSEDIYQPALPDLHWVFGATGDRVSVISTYRMGTGNGLLGDAREQTRLRKMVTRYIGFSYFGLARSQDPYSVLYDNILGPFDLDVMGEDY